MKSLHIYIGEDLSVASHLDGEITSYKPASFQALKRVLNTIVKEFETVQIAREHMLDKLYNRPETLFEKEIEELKVMDHNCMWEEHGDCEFCEALFNVSDKSHTPSVMEEAYIKSSPLAPNVW
jgi:hypothetical protein